MDPEKIRAITQTPVPLNRRELRAFLGATGYYRKHVKGYTFIAASLYAITGNTATFEWTEERQKAFDELRRQIAENLNA